MEGRTINIQAIINPISGVGSKRKIPKMIENAFVGGNCCVEISFTEYPGHASELTRQALDNGANWWRRDRERDCLCHAPFGCRAGNYPERVRQWLGT